jgi:hypothetical protein
MVIALIISLGLVLLNPSIGIGLTLFVMVFNIATHFKYKAEIDNYIILIAFQLRLLDSIEEFNKISIPDLDLYQKKIKFRYKNI